MIVLVIEYSYHDRSSKKFKVTPSVHNILQHVPENSSYVVQCVHTTRRDAYVHDDEYKFEPAHKMKRELKGGKNLIIMTHVLLGSL
jgi:hypothetical protein